MKKQRIQKLAGISINEVVEPEGRDPRGLQKYRRYNIRIKSE